MKAVSLIVSVAIVAAITGGIYMLVKPNDYTREELGKKLLRMAVIGIKNSADGNTPLELRCTRNGEPVGIDPTIVVCAGTGSKGPFKATFIAGAQTRIPEFSLAGQGSGAGLLLTKFDGVPAHVPSLLGADFEQVFMMSPQISN